MESLKATGSYRIAGCGLWGDVAFGLRAKGACVKFVCRPHIGLALTTAGRWGFYPHRFAGHLVVGYVDGAGHVGLERRGDAENSEVGVRNSESELETQIQSSLAFLEETPWPRGTMAGNSADPGAMWRKDLWACEPLAPSRAGHGEVEVRNGAGHK